MENNYFFISYLIFFTFFTAPNLEVLGQESRQTFTIPTNQTDIDGNVMNIGPGDSILLEGGVRPKLKIINVKGSAGQPVIIANKDEKVIVETKAHTGISIEHSAYIHLTGTGGSDQYGIEIASAGSMGIYVTEYTTDCEIDHLEIHNAGFAGIMAKTDPNCNREDLRDYIMKNISFHDNYIYDTGGEGYYVGYSSYPTKKVDCSGSQTVLYPHSIQGVRIYNNIIRDTGWDGLQVGSATANVLIYSNSIVNTGLKNQEYQNHAVQIGEGTTGDFYNNYIYNAQGGGISFFGSGNNRLFNNVIVQVGGNAIYHNDRGAGNGTKYQIYNNTIISPSRAALDLNATKTRNNLVANNLIVLNGAFYGITGDVTAWKNEGNQMYGKTEEVGFADAEKFDFSLIAEAKCVDAGFYISYLNFDHQFNSRPANGKIDVGAFEFGSVPYVAPALSVAKEMEQGVSIFPNPTVDVVNIKVTGKRIPDSIIIYDQMGKIVLNEALEFNGKFDYRIQLDSHWTEGIYFVSLYEKNQQISVQKLIINN